MACSKEKRLWALYSGPDNLDDYYAPLPNNGKDSTKREELRGTIAGVGLYHQEIDEISSLGIEVWE